MIQIAVVDDKPANRRIVTEKLHTTNRNFQVMMQCVDGGDFLQQMAQIPEINLPQIVLMDIEMPNVNGITAIATASAIYPDVKFVVLSIFDDEEMIFNAIKAGACGYVLKEENSETLQRMLLNLNETGAGPISPGIAYKILQMVQTETTKNQNKNNDNIFNLSDREKEILKLLCQGLDYKTIGEKLFISANTVKKHCINIYQKLHVSSRSQALRVAYTKGLVD